MLKQYSDILSQISWALTKSLLSMSIKSMNIEWFYNIIEGVNILIIEIHNKWEWIRLI